MKQNLLKLIGSVAMVSVLFSACIKDDDVELTTQGSSFIKVLQAPENAIFFSPFSDIKSVDLFSLRKNAASNADLMSPTAVKMTLVPDYIDRYNDANGTTFEELPDSLYTTAIAKTGSVYDMSLAAGEAAKEFTIKLNGTKWDLSHTYALAFALSDVGGLKINDGKDTIIALLSVKNRWDGIYEVTGTFSDATNAAFTNAYPLEWQLQTSGPNTCIVADMVELGFPGYLFYTGAGYSYYGSFGLIVTFDPATDKIVKVENYYGMPANTRSAALDPTGINAYQSDTKTINIKYFMIQPSAVPAAPHIRSRFDEVWKYKGER